MIKSLKSGLLTITTSLGVAFSATYAAAEDATVVGENYEATIWVDPDGCQHWVMDDGFEGYMTPRRTRDGRPVCNTSEICGVIPTDQLFATDQAWISRAAKGQLATFFTETNAFGYLIYGHTDRRATDEYNMRLSQQRADAVADVARDAGVRVVESRGLGERQPRAEGGSAAALQQNRRVEIYCLK